MNLMSARGAIIPAALTFAAVLWWAGRGSSVAKLTNSRLHNSGSLCIGSWSSCTGSGNTNY